MKDMCSSVLKKDGARLMGNGPVNNRGASQQVMHVSLCYQNTNC